jgi:16S rRNA G966 N2-methylase RsmD
MSLKLGIPYMGSKRQIACKLVDKILQDNPNCKYVYDLFGGGGAMSFEFLQRSQIKQVFYNELDTGITELLKKIQKDGITKEFYDWISREDFLKYNKGNDWKAGLVKTCWSFGNKCTAYIYGKDIEQYKYWFHQVVINNIDYTKEIQEFYENSVLNKYNIKQQCKIVMPIKKDIQDRRLEIRQQLNVFEKECKLSHSRVVQQLQHLENLQQLERLQQLEKIKESNIFNNLIILNQSYNEVAIETPIEETIIYLDPPYENTVKYQNNINHKDLYEWINKSNYKIYLSSYQAPLNEVFSINHRSTLSATNKSKVVQEKLFCNKISVNKYYSLLEKFELLDCLLIILMLVNMNIFSLCL